VKGAWYSLSVPSGFQFECENNKFSKISVSVNYICIAFGDSVIKRRELGFH